jgi:hypothetical protein
VKRSASWYLKEVSKTGFSLNLQAQENLASAEACFIGIVGRKREGSRKHLFSSFNFPV